MNSESSTTLDLVPRAAPLCGRTLFQSFILMLGSLNFGFNLGFGIPAVRSLIDYLDASPSRSMANLFQTATSFVAIFGPCLTHLLLRRFRRRITALLFSICATIGWLLFLIFLFRTSLWVGIAVRGLCGLIAGGFSTLIPVYMVELAPDASTGFFGGLNQVGTSLGVTIAGTFTLAHSQYLWLIMAVFGAVATLVLALLVRFVDESPADAAAPPPDSWNGIRIQQILLCTALMLFQQTTGSTSSWGWPTRSFCQAVAVSRRSGRRRRPSSAPS
jgi:MFS family permease